MAIQAKYKYTLPLILFIFSLLIFPSLAFTASVGTKAMVATADPKATAAALEILKQGGNAVDAAIAAQWVLNVAEPQSSGLGGGGFFLYYSAKDKQVYAFDGRETAPSQIDPELYLDEEGHPIPYIPDRVTGGHSVGVPGTLKLLETVHKRFAGTRFSFSDLFQPAIDLAENGFEIPERLSAFLASEKERLALFPETRKIFFKDDVDPLREGDWLVQKDLAESFRFLQREGPSAFYEGAIAKDVVQAVRSASYRPGIMSLEDLAAYEVKEREAVHGTYRGYEIFGMGPPSSGGTTLIEILNIMEHFNVSQRDAAVDRTHLFSEAQRLAFIDRNRFLGDPDFSSIPVDEIISKNFAENRAEEIYLDRAGDESVSASVDLHHTSHISIVDEAGNMVSFTTTIEHIFGSCIVVPGRGFFLNNELSDFDAEPRDAGELKVNVPEGSKRPRSSMTPTMVFKENQPVMILGSPGGTTIISTVANILINRVDLGMDPEAAVRAPRILNRGGALELEGPLMQNLDLILDLEALGHEVRLRDTYGNAQCIFFNGEDHLITGVSDPRGDGEAQGY